MCRKQRRGVPVCGYHAIRAVLSYANLWRTRVLAAATTGTVAAGAGRIVRCFNAIRSQMGCARSVQ